MAEEKTITIINWGIFKNWQITEIRKRPLNFDLFTNNMIVEEKGSINGIGYEKDGEEKDLYMEEVTYESRKEWFKEEKEKIGDQFDEN